MTGDLIIMNSITIGSDPEVFIKGDDGIIPIVGLLGGTKRKPIKVDCGAVQEDNVLGEFNTDPAISSDSFLYNIKSVMQQLENKIKPYKIEVLSSHIFDKSVLKSAGRQALEFGCSPDYNAWTGKENESPSPYTTLRTAGGHVHVGWNNGEDSAESKFNVIKLMDVYLGIPSVLLDHDSQRRSLYGKAGACRIKEYGVEYRVLSNFWLNDDARIKWIFDQSIKAVENSGYIDEILTKYSSETIQSIINSSDVAGAAEVVKNLQLEI